ncbi:MAG: YdcF family protein [Lachnospiraceae bacterium]|nr:YdcF family protein [Lachnospiraceae bacterium]
MDNKSNRVWLTVRGLLPTVLWVGAGLCLIAYSRVAYRAGSGTRFYLVWLCLGIACFLMEVLRRLKVWTRLPRALKIVFLSLLGLGLGLFFSVEGFIISGFNAKGEPGLDYVIVLGAQVRTNGPSVVLRYRLDKAYEYLLENPGTVAICTGGQGANEPVAEGIAMKEYLVSKGIPPERIIAEDRAGNTIQNIRFSYEFLDPLADSIGIITNNFHVFRGVSIAKKQGGSHVVGIAADSHPVYLPTNMLRECIGVIKDKLLGNM